MYLLRRSSIVVVLLSVACASLPLKERIAEDLSAVHTTLGALQDAEIRLYGDGTLQISEENHVKFHTLLIKAFDAEIKLADAMQQWRANDPVPEDFNTLTRYVNDVIDYAQNFTSSEWDVIIDLGQTALRQIAVMRSLFSGPEISSLR